MTNQAYKPKLSNLRKGMIVLDLQQESPREDKRKKKKLWLGKISKVSVKTGKIHIDFASARDGRPYELITEPRFYNRSWKLKNEPRTSNDRESS